MSLYKCESCNQTLNQSSTQSVIRNLPMMDIPHEGQVFIKEYGQSLCPACLMEHMGGPINDF